MPPVRVIPLTMPEDSDYTYTGSGTNSQVSLAPSTYVHTSRIDHAARCPRRETTTAAVTMAALELGTTTRTSKLLWRCFRVNDDGIHYYWWHRDGSYYYSNPNGSQYYNSGSGYSQYTSPSGDVTKSNGSSSK